MTERALQDLIILCCRAMGLLVYHTHDSRRSEPGFPDLVIVGAHGVLYRELKSARGQVSPEQEYWIEALTEAGCDVGLWRPVDWPHTITTELEQLGRLKAQRPLPSQAQLRRKLQGRNSRGN